MSGVRQALRPVLIFAAACNVQMFEYRVVLLNYIQYMILWLTYGIAIAALCKWTILLKAFSEDMFWIVFLFNANTGIVVTGLALLHKKKFQDCLDGLSIINTSLGQIDIPDEYRTLHMSAWRVIGILCFTAIYIVVESGPWAFEVFGRLTGFVVIAVLNYANFVNFCTFLITCLILRYTGSRFDRINKYVAALSKHVSYKSTCPPEYRSSVYAFPNPVVLKKQERVIWFIMHVHWALCRVSRDFNAIFSLQVTLEIGSYFLYVTILFDYLCEWHMVGIHCTLSLSCLAQKMSEAYMEWTLAVLCIARLIYFNHVCESVCVKANSTRIFVHNLLNCANSVQLHCEAAQFILHMVNQPLQFDGIGMFYFGYGFVYTKYIVSYWGVFLCNGTMTEHVVMLMGVAFLFLGAISTVLVIILQTSYSAVPASQNGTSVNVS